MRDGVRLATDAYHCPAAGPGRASPVILIRTPYDKNLAAEGVYARGGYVVVVQDTRGRFSSEGVWEMLTCDGPDGQDTLAWLAEQDWCDGSRVGMMGTSYVGGTQIAAAMAPGGSPNLKAVIPVDAMANMGYESMRNGGAFELRFWNWIMGAKKTMGAPWGSAAARDPAVAPALQGMARDRLDYLAQLPLRPGTTPLKHAPEYERWLVEAMATGGNAPFFSANAVHDRPRDYGAGVATYLVGGWYDSWCGNTLRNYVALREQLTAPLSLIMGPWIHGQNAHHQHGQVDFGPAAAIADPVAWRTAWFDAALKGDAAVVGQKEPFRAPVRLFVMGGGNGRRTAAGQLLHGGAWRDEPAWPLARAVATPFYLRAGGGLSRSPEQAAAAPSDHKIRGASTSFQYDPTDPVPNIGGCNSSNIGLMVQGAWDQCSGPHLKAAIASESDLTPRVFDAPAALPLSARRDVLVFQTEPLEAPLEVVGPVVATLYAESDCLDTDFTAKLVDVYPPSADFPGGFDLNVCDGIVRARFRGGPNAPEELLAPGTVYAFEISLYATANLFQVGHRLRLDISSSNFPRFDANPNTGEPLNGHRTTRVAKNTVHHSGVYASRVNLCIMPVEVGSKL
jgi:putative CocE/NonD family hydrolase